MLETNEEVPFRMTPNLARALTPFLVDGVLVSTMASVSVCVCGGGDAGWIVGVDGWVKGGNAPMTIEDSCIPLSD